MDTDLFLLLANDLSFFFNEVDVFEILHLLVDYFFLEAKPNIVGDGQIVNAPAD